MQAPSQSSPGLSRLLPVFVALIVASLAAGAFAAGPSCGAPGKPACPLQQWMRAHAAAPLATRDFAALEKSFQAMARQNPEPVKWANWTKIAGDGEKAAREQRLGGVRETCGRCHRAYRRAYNSRYRTRGVVE